MTYSTLSEVPFSLIQSVFKQYTSQGNKGSRHRLCCFHNEKTPSANLYQTSNGIFYKCFGCGEAMNFFTFLLRQNKSPKEVCQELSLHYDESWKRKEKYTGGERGRKDEVKKLMIQKYSKTIDKNNIYTLEENDIYQYVGESSSYYKCIFRSSKMSKVKEPRICHFDDNGKIQYSAPEEQIPYNYLEAIDWHLDFEKKLIIVEGEKDVETIRYKLQDRYLDEKYIPISFKGLTREARLKYFKKIFIEQFFHLPEADINRKKSVYFLGDSDDAGSKYMQDIFFDCKDFVRSFHLVELPRIHRCGKGADVTDWLQYMLKSKHSIEHIKSLFDSTLFNVEELQDYKRSKYWAIFDDKFKKEKDGTITDKSLPRICVKNIATFFKAMNCDLKMEVISRQVTGKLGLLEETRDSDNASDGLRYELLMQKLGLTRLDNHGSMQAGMQLNNSDKLSRLMKDYLSDRQYNDMLDKITEKRTSAQPVDIYSYSFSYGSRTYNYPASPLLYFLLENIGFTASAPQAQSFQKILILKVLLMLPHMIRNSLENKFKMNGILYLVGKNGIGKTDFIHHLFGHNMGVSDLHWVNKVSRLDIASRESLKLAFRSPCVFLDEGNIHGSVAEKRAFYDNYFYEYIDKYETKITSVPKRSIIIASSNSKEVSEDLEGERRLWAVEVESFPHLIKLKKTIYNSGRWDNFFDNYDVEYFDLKGETYFKFPVLEFWKEMNELYENYCTNEILEQSLILQSGELAYYKNVWMVDKYKLDNLVQKIADLHHWGDEPVPIPIEYFEQIANLYYQSIPKETSLKREYNSYIKALNNEKYLYSEGRNKIIDGKLRRVRWLPPLRTDVVNNITKNGEDKNIFFDGFRIRDYCRSTDENTGVTIENFVNELKAMPKEKELRQAIEC